MCVRLQVTKGNVPYYSVCVCECEVCDSCKSVDVYYTRVSSIPSHPVCLSLITAIQVQVCSTVL